MNIRNIIMLLLAIASAGATGYAVLDFMDKQRLQAELKVEETTTVIVQEKASLVALIASGDLKPGQFVRPEDLDWQPWPEEANHERFVTLSDEDADNDELADEALTSFKGGVVRTSVLKGQPIQKGLVVFPGERGFLAAVLKPGMQAVSVSIAKETGVSGLVFPGDRVDVVVALRIKGEDVQGNSVTRYVSTTMLENVRVLAIDQALSPNEDEEAMEGKTATLEVSPNQARKVSVAREMGQISLALRSLAIDDAQIAMADEGFLETPGTRKASFVQPLGSAVKKEKKNTERNFTLDTEVFTINGRDMTLMMGGGKSKEQDQVVVLRGNQTDGKK